MKKEKLIINKKLKVREFGIFLFILCSFLFITGCEDALDTNTKSSALEPGFGKVNINVTGGQSRTVFPVKIFDNYVYTFWRDGNNSQQILEPDTQGFFTLQTGNWTVEVKAYVDGIDPANLAAIGVSDMFAVSAAANNPVVVVLTENNTGSGTGTFSYTVQYPSDADITITLEKLPGLENVSLIPENSIADNGDYVYLQTLDVDSGFYLFTVTLEKDGYYAGSSKAVHIYSLLSSSYSVAFTEEDFIPTGTTIGLEYTLIDDDTAYSVSKGNVTDAVVVIPSAYNGLPVTTIVGSSFQNYTELIEITIPNSVTSIDSGVFQGCNNLTKITIPFVGKTLDGTTNTFFGYIFGATSEYYQNWSIPASLKTVIITSTNSIGIAAFQNCSELTSITIPNSVTSIGQYAFQNCSGLTSIGEVGSGASIEIPSSVKSIEQCVFSDCSGLTSITIPNSVTSIEQSAFSSCEALTSVTIGNGVTSISSDAFSYSGGLSSITVESSNITYRSEGNCLIRNSDNRLILGTNNSVIPSGVDRIEQHAFYGCSELTSITIPTGVTVISQYAFYSCSGLTSITIPTSVTSIGQYAFRGCSGLTSITVESSNKNYRSEGNCLIQNSNNRLILGTNNSVIPSGVISIGDYAFYECSKLMNITLPDSVTSIGIAAFYNCSDLTSITIPPNVTSIGMQAFYNCSGLTSITLPDNVTTIGPGAFEVCIGLRSITIPYSVTYISYFTFRSCNSLNTVYYGGEDETAWNEITIHSSYNDNLINAARYYYSETDPGSVDTHWRWVDGEPAIWE